MCHFSRPISISLSPNTQKDDISLALRLLFQPWRWKQQARSFRFISRKEKSEESQAARLEGEFKKYLGVSHALAFNSGRSSLIAILTSLGLEYGDEILVQAFTCNASVNPILWSGFTPIYVDCNEKSFNMDIGDLKSKITRKSKAIMVQHTFGLPADMDEIVEICHRYNLILIEDCAHALGAEYKGRKVGTFGDAAFFSFSRDKIISSVYGGMAVTNRDDIANKLVVFQRECSFPSCFWIWQQLLHPVLLNWLILPTYRLMNLGKILIIFCQKFKVLSKAVHWKEKRGEMPRYFPSKTPDALASLALKQLKKLEILNAHRKEMANFYYRALADTAFALPPIYGDREQVFLRFTVKHVDAHKIIKEAWGKGLLLGDWYTSPIVPDDTKLEKLKYTSGCCHQAEKLSKITFNLPTHINIKHKEAKKIVDFLKSYGN